MKAEYKKKNKLDKSFYDNLQKSKTFGEFLKNEIGNCVTSFSDYCGIDRSTMNKYINNIKSPDVLSLHAIVDALGADTFYTEIEMLAYPQVKLFKKYMKEKHTVSSSYIGARKLND